MEFITDKQTLTDLNLLGKYKVGSMFNLFNRVKTRGGELLLEDMFRKPLQNMSAINLRARQIEYLSGTSVKLEINPEHAELATHYLTEPRPGSKLSSTFSCWIDKTQEVIYGSHKLAEQQRHIHAVHEILFTAGQLLGQLQKLKKPVNPCTGLQESLEQILRIADIRQLKARYPYTLTQVAHLRYIFLRKHREDIGRLIQLIYEFDVLLSVAQVAHDKKMIFAEALNGNQETLISAENLRHPSLTNAVGNEIGLHVKSNVVFLTGANMAGKSTWMKTLGVSFYLAHMGFPVAASSMKFSVMEGIFTSINVPDDISLGWSHFYAEVMRVKLVAKEVSSGKRLFILFDELFKGTNVKDAYDATLAVTEKLAKYDTCAFVISTHIIEVGEVLKDIKNIQFRYMPTVMKGTVPHYTYTLAEGITDDRQGMIIIENEGILQMLNEVLISERQTQSKYEA